MLEINREVLAAVDWLDERLTDFRGLRSIWADTVANHANYGMDAAALDQRQKETLSMVISAALNLWEKFNPATGFASRGVEYHQLKPVRVADAKPKNSDYVMIEIIYHVSDDEAGVSQWDHDWIVGYYDKCITGEYKFYDARHRKALPSSGVVRWCQLPSLEIDEDN